MKINLGCGYTKKKGYLNCDLSKEVKPDKIINLEKPLPWKDNSVDEIIANNVLEHIQNIIPLLKEIYRICKKNAMIKIIVPHYASRAAWSDLTHVRPFSWSSFDYVAYNPSKKNNLANKESHEYGNMKFSINKTFFFGRFYNATKIIPLFANNFPSIYETFFCYLFAPAGIKFKLKVKK